MEEEGRKREKEKHAWRLKGKGVKVVEVREKGVQWKTG